MTIANVGVKPLPLGAQIGIVVALILGTPVRAQTVMSFEEYQAVDHSEPYVYRIEADSGALLYFGSRHSFDPEDPQMDTLRRVWNAFEPDVAFTEGTEVSSIDTLSRTDLIRRYGEVGMTWHLAQRDGVPVRTLDPSRKAEIDHLMQKGWTGEQLMLFYTLRQVAQSQDQEVSVELTEVVPKYLTSLAERFPLQGPTTLAQFEAAVARHLPDVQNWTALSRSYFYPGPQDPSYFTNKISTDSNQFRDQHHADLLIEAVRSGKRVFAIAGSAHAVMQEPALRGTLRPPDNHGDDR